jgi:hypothetical protein
VTLNDPQFVEAARNLAQRALQATPDRGERIDFIVRQLLARSLAEKEMAIVRDSLGRFQRHYSTHVDDARRLIDVGESKANETFKPAELAAWTMIANQLMNLDEVLNK